MTDTPAQRIKRLLPLWYANIAWAKELIRAGFNLTKADDILRPEFRGIRRIPGTTWFIRTHGIGVDVFKTPDVGGIDFDFDKPDPDEWRLRILFEKLLNDGQISFVEYQDLADDEELLKNAIRAALNEA